MKAVQCLLIKHRDIVHFKSSTSQDTSFLSYNAMTINYDFNFLTGLIIA